MSDEVNIRSRSFIKIGALILLLHTREGVWHDEEIHPSFRMIVVGKDGYKINMRAEDRLTQVFM